MTQRGGGRKGREPYSASTHQDSKRSHSESLNAGFGEKSERTKKREEETDID